MRRLNYSIALVALILAVATSVALNSGYVFAQEPSLTVAPANAACGDTVEVSGHGFPANTEIFVTVTRGGDHHLDTSPVVVSDDTGAFTASVQVDTYSCPSPYGTIAFACALPLCDYKVSVPFQIAGESILPGAGAGFTGTGLVFTLAIAGLLIAGVSLIGMSLLAKVVAISGERHTLP